VSSNPGVASVTNAGVVTAVSAGSATFTFTSTAGCSSSPTSAITVNPDPVIAGVSDQTVCAGNSTTPITFTGTPAAGVSYAWTNDNTGSGLSASGPGNIGSFTTTNSTSSPIVSTVTVTPTITATGCSGTPINFTITVNPTPVVDLTNIVETDPSACATATGSITGITATGSPTLSYSWNSTPVQTGIDLTGVLAGSYSLTVTDGNSCISSVGPFSLTDPNPPATPTLSLSPGPLCDGGTFTINVDSPIAGATYNWTSSPSGYTNTGTSVTINNAVPGTVTYTATPTLSGCVGTGGSIAVTINTLPYVDIQAPITVSCDNPVISLDGSNSEQSANTSYIWNVSNGGVIIGAGNNDTDSTSTAGDYELMVTNSTTGCSNSQTVTVTSNTNTPTADISVPNGGQLDCANPSLTLDGTASTNDAGGSTGITYTWSNTSGGSTIGSSPTLTASAAGDYYLLVEETISGCTDEIMVTISAATGLPTAVVTGNVPLTCTTTSITVDGSSSTPLGAVDYEWNTDPVTTPLGTGSTLNITTPGDYILIVTDPLNGCSNNNNFTVIEDITTPVVVVTTPLVVNCVDSIVILDGTNSDQGSNFTYAWTNSGTGVIIGTADADFDSTSTSDTYTLTVTNTDNGCTNSEDITVTMDTVSPIADAGTDINFPCGVSSVSLDGTGSTGNGLTYDWSGPATISDNTIVSPTSNGTGQFTLIVTATNGCSASDIVDIIPDANAPIADAGTDITIDCNNLTNPIAVNLDGTGSDSGMDYLWSTTGTGVITNGTTTTPTVDQAGFYTITVTNTANSCQSSDEVEIKMDTVSPIADAGVANPIDCNSGLVTNLDATNSIGSGLTYVWSTSNGTIDSQLNGIATVSDAGDYDVTVTQSNGCSSTATISITMDTVSPMISIPTPGDIDCNGSPITIDASGTTGNNETYLWSTTETSNSIIITSAGTYSLTVTNDNGCSSTSSVTVNSLPAPIASFTATPTSGQVPLDVDYSNNSTGTSLTYSWAFGDGNFDTNSDPSNTFNAIGDFNTVLTVTDAAGCTDTASVIISVTGTSNLIVPNIFSPNGDDVNDIFNVDGTNITEIKGTIINRWGQTIYSWDVLEIGWDGHTVSGAIASEGTYFYIIDAIGADGTVYNLQGPFQLVR
jgi:gliding motility-associated-like protein